MSMRRIYRKIAKEHGVSVAEVKRDMQVAIDYAYERHNLSTGEKTLQKGIPRKKEVPTAEELIRYAITKIK